MREIAQVVTGNRAIDGAGVHLVRVLGRPTITDFDPFLMLDAFDSTDPKDYIKGFPWHPHRGIETVTYLAQGHIIHSDSLGNAGDIKDGGCQWMTAGSGIMHQEMPQASPRMLGLQLWLNLPREGKMTPPKYNDIRDEDVKVVTDAGASVRVLSGQYKGTSGVMAGDHVKMTMLDITLQPGAHFHMDTPRDETLFVYPFSGSGQFGPSLREEGARQAILFTQGDEVAFTAGKEGMHLMLFMGRPLKEPISWGGPIVMNTRDELMKAFDDLDRGTFIKV
ncbi:MAG: pirin family protein [Clostridiales bacterium]|nr:pirin family protein [Clostridiales bacterium]